ncbi:Alpha-2-macroglobulin family [Popillia japonica]|uniref:Alpha-2-macroglobulin family n=1 Tax=Popillia japonica TaxID=7064 RepID=A0AAW1LQ91_POPJA
MGCCGLEKSGKLANGYAFYYPHSMGAKQAAKVCLAIDQHLLPAVIEITFENKICEGTTCNPRTISQEFSCWKIIAPDQPKSDYSPTKLEVQIATNDNNIKFTEHNNVQIVNDNAVILETDRSTYNLGDLVKMRVVAFDFNLKPIMNYIAKVLNYPLQYQPIQFLRIWYSKSKNAIKITSAEQNTVDCESKLEFTVLYNSRRFKKCQEVEFNYIVDAKWSEKSLYPGEVGTLSIETDKGSVCSVSSIDKASTFLGSSTQISKDSVVNRFYRYYYGYELNCIPPKNETSETTTTAPFPDYIGYTYYSSLYDSFDAFRDSNIGIISNFRFIAKTCEKTSIIPEMAMTGSGGATTESPTDSRGSTIRSFFPETWLWDLVPVPKGKTAIERKLPDSITNWEGNVVCMSKNEGIGISEKIEIQGFKPFFIDILLPYSIKRNKETLHLPIPIFNYLDHDLPGLASAKNQTTALTSYVLISLLETNLQIDETVLANAKAFLPMLKRAL